MPAQKYARVQEIEAIRFTGENIDEIDIWMGKTHTEDRTQIKICGAVGLVNLYSGQYVVKMQNAFFVWDDEILNGASGFRLVPISQE